MRDRQVILANIKPHQNTCPQGLVFVTLWREVHISAMWLRSLVSSTFVLVPLPSPPSSPYPTLPTFYLPYLPILLHKVVMRDRQVILANIKPHQNTCPQGLVFVTFWREVHISAMWLRSLVSSTFVLVPYPPLPPPPFLPSTYPIYPLPILPTPPHPLLYQSSLTSSPTYPLYPLTLPLPYPTHAYPLTLPLPYPTHAYPLTFPPSLPLSLPLSPTLATHTLQPHLSPNDVVFCTYFGYIYGPVPGSGGTSMKENVQSKNT